MPKYNFVVERTYTWSIRIEASNKEEADLIMDKKLSNDKFDNANAQEGYLEIIAELPSIDKDYCRCPLGGDQSNDCQECCYSIDYHFINGKCVERNG